MSSFSITGIKGESRKKTRGRPRKTSLEVDQKLLIEIQRRSALSNPMLPSEVTSMMIAETNQSVSDGWVHQWIMRNTCIAEKKMVPIEKERNSFDEVQFIEHLENLKERIEGLQAHRIANLDETMITEGKSREKSKITVMATEFQQNTFPFEKEGFHTTAIPVVWADGFQTSHGIISPRKNQC